MGEEIGEEDDEDIVMGIDEGVVGGWEECEDRVEEEERDDGEWDRDDEIERNCVRENVLGCGIVFLSEVEGDGSRWW